MKKEEVLQYILGFVLIAFILGLIQGQPIPQDKSYHNFADNCTHYGIPHFWNVISNIPLILCGLLFFRSSKNQSKFLNLIPKLMGIGFITTGIGSAFYHWNPNNYTLVWDRIPMTIVFVTFFHLLTHQNVSKTIAKYSLIPSLILGVLSVVYWIYTEHTSSGDLRFYIIIQFYPLAATFIILTSAWKTIKGRFWILLAFLFYMFAKFSETQLDEYLFSATHLSGHTVKHFCSAASGIALYYWVKKATNN